MDLKDLIWFQLQENEDITVINTMTHIKWVDILSSRHG